MDPLLVAGYEIDLSEAVEIICENEYERIGLQVPEGLKRQAKLIASVLEEQAGCAVVLLADPCFGACDPLSCDLEGLGIEFGIQIGHADFPCGQEGGLTTLMVNAKSVLALDKVTRMALESLPEGRIGVVSTAQHCHRLGEVKEVLEGAGFEVVLGSGDGRIAFDGQVLGCNFSSARAIEDEVDAFLFVGSGMFHVLGLSLATKKPVVAADPYTMQVLSDEVEEAKETFLRQRYGAIAVSKAAQSFGVLVCSKPGQARMDLALDIVETLKNTGRQAILVAMQRVDAPFLEGFGGIDCWVSTGCPRIAIDDFVQFKAPMITPVELEVVLSLREWEDVVFDEIMVDECDE